MQDRRTPSEIDRDRRREAKLVAKAEAEKQRLVRAEVERLGAIATHFPQIPVDQIGAHYHVHAAHLGSELEATLETWARLFNRSAKRHAKAVAAGDTGTAALALDEVEQIRGIAEQVAAAFALEDARRLEAAAA